MPPSDPPSNIRVFVRWHDHTVFAGEEVRCTITFKNVASRPREQQQRQSSRPQPNLEHHHPPRLGGAPLQARAANAAAAAAGLTPPGSARGAGGGGRRASLSLSVPATAGSGGRGGGGTTAWSPPAGQPQQQHQQENRPTHRHKRSISIVSIGSSVGTVEEHQHQHQQNQQQRGNAAPARSGRQGRGHARASSLQIVSRGVSGGHAGSNSASPRHISSPLHNSSFPHDRSSGSSTNPSTPGLRSPRSTSNPMAEFRFPTTQSPLSEDATDLGGRSHLDDHILSPTSSAPPPSAMKMALRSKDGNSVPTINEHGVAPSARILSGTSLGTGTPRSSGEFYNMSNNSTETLASEYVATQQPLRGQTSRTPHSRRTSGLSLQQHQSRTMPESLMMGYAQIQGSFTLDGSLINLAPFEQVKRKAVVGGQGGGGVIGVETATKRDSGLLRGFGWGNISSSLGELLGGGELSTIKEMRGMASAKAVPLLSTPQSILFVDLQLAPGESRAYEYSFRLPRGLPPSHRGKAVKISYGLVIGTQRAGGAKEQQVRSVDVPFRVLGSVNSHGEILGHDLMSPYVLLRDQAKIKPVESKSPSTTPTEKTASRRTPATTPPVNGGGGGSSGASDFMSYVDELLARPRHGSGAGVLLSPTAAGPNSRRTSAFEEATTAKEAIDLAVLRANLTSTVSGGYGNGENDDGHARQPAQSPNRFEIARDGRRVAVVMITRPAFRLGEAVTLAVDFRDADLPCLAVHASLESSERVDPSLALRSEASVHRVTKRTHAAASEATLFARRIVFAPTIPVSATPEFVTSGVSLDWKVRLEFVVPASGGEASRSRSRPPTRGSSGAGGGGGLRDDRGEEEGENGEGGSEREGEGEDDGETTLLRESPDRSRRAPHPLLEEISRDDKGGLVLVAVENLACESFEVAVPLRVYGAATSGLERLERDDALEEGLAV